MAILAPISEPATRRRLWVDHLDSLLQPTWRSIEWNQGSLIFTGDPDNPRTKVARCPTDGCGVAVEVENSLCAACRTALRRSGLSRAEFDVSYRPKFRVGTISGPGDAPALPVTGGPEILGQHLGRNQFSLVGRCPTFRAEIIYGLQQRDEQDFTLAPQTVRVMLSRIPMTTQSLIDMGPNMSAGTTAVVVGLYRSLFLHLQRTRGAFEGSDFTEGDVWNPALVGLISAPNRRYVAAFGSIDFRPIRQDWLRELAKSYGRAVRLPASEMQRVVRASTLAASVLAGRPNGEYPEKLSMADMTAIVDGFRRSTHTDGSPYSNSHRVALLSHFRGMMEFCRTGGQMDHIPSGFAFNSRYHRIGRQPISEDLIGRGIPEHVIAQMDKHLPLMGQVSTFHQGGWTAQDFGEMYCTIYKLLRDTGRRPNEIVSLKRDCLQWVSGKPTLVWDNHKRGRMGRRLPIHSETAETIRSWTAKVEALPQILGAAQWLFPAPGARNRQRRGHATAAIFQGKVFAYWIAAIPQLLDVGITSDGEAQIYDRSTITPYGFRHAYAQRHADNGTPVDVLRELMDHRSVETTMGYYQVSLTRKRAAIDAVAGFAVDRNGSPRPISDSLTYQQESVSVPFGNCTEPSNVKAGGKHCPIRYQCAGCNFYRPDPSYLTAIDEHITSLRADRETAMATEAASWVIANFEDQIAAFTKVRDSMRDVLTNLPKDAQEGINEASRILRKDRAATAFIPLSVISVSDQR